MLLMKVAQAIAIQTAKDSKLADEFTDHRAHNFALLGALSSAHSLPYLRADTITIIAADASTNTGAY